MDRVAHAPHTGEAQRIRVALYGAVQGVGFRPFVYRLARELGVAGTVLNSGAGLVVDAEADAGTLAAFLERLERERPSASVVLAREVTRLQAAGTRGFAIVESDGGPRMTSLLPDLATCPECVAEILDPAERRFGYAFTNCTRCGPRYTIVQELPWDRPRTAMAQFAMCPECLAEYSDPADRRFHAQPIACPACGPRLSASVEQAAEVLRAGGIVALKGIGGYQLLTDARSEAAVRRLRERKQRDAKPLAVMMPDVGSVRRWCIVSPAEEAALCSPAAPIVLLTPCGAEAPAPNVCDASPFIGVMLPYSPLHHLLMRAWPHPVVATSGNLSSEPIVTSDQAARHKLGSIADLILAHDRPIARPVDDSVVRVCAGVETVLRRARGYAPLPVRVRRELPRVLATGAHMKSAVAIAVGRNVYVSQHIGDLDTVESMDAFEQAIADLCRLYDFVPEAIACDLHPDYASTLWAEAAGKPLVRVQHHMAHAAACAAENDLAEPHLAVVWDGTGYGLDGTIWGGEFFAVENGVYERVAHLRTFRLPGGDAAVREGWRAAAALQFELGTGDVDPVIARMLERGVNAPLTSSAGRLFDAVAALTGVAQESRFEGQAAMLLERAATGAEAHRTYTISGGDWREMIAAVMEDVADGVPASAIAAAFHAALADWVAEEARVWRDVVLSGGVFQNALLTGLVLQRLAAAGKRVHLHQRIPPNDGGIALGQAVIAGGQKKRAGAPDRAPARRVELRLAD